MEAFGLHWLLSCHFRRAALVRSHGDARSCQMPKMLAAVHCQARLDWVMLLAPASADVISFWLVLTHCVEAAQQGRSPIAIGKLMRSTGTAVGASVLAGVFQPSGFVNTAGSAAIRFLTGFRRFDWASKLLNRIADGFWSIERVRGSPAFRMYVRLRALGEVAESG